MKPHSRRQFLRGSLAVASISLLAGCGVLPSSSQQGARIPRIGYLIFGRSEPDPLDDAFQQGLAELGYVEGSNLAIERGFTQQAELLPNLTAELVRLPVDLIVAGGGAVNAAKDATRTIPIVMPVSGDPVGQGLVAGLARPGANITGLTTQSSSPLAGKRLQLLKETVAHVSRVAVLWNPGNTAKVLEFQQAQAAATGLGLRLHSAEVRGPNDLDDALNAATAWQPNAFQALNESLINAHAARITDFALSSRLPSVFEQRELVHAGGLISYGPNVRDLFRRAATYVDKILKGANPAEFPVEQPTKFDFVINLKTAQTLGLILPQEVQMQATEVIQ